MIRRSAETAQAHAHGQARAHATVATPDRTASSDLGSRSDAAGFSAAGGSVVSARDGEPVGALPRAVAAGSVAAGHTMTAQERSTRAAAAASAGASTGKTAALAAGGGAAGAYVVPLRDAPSNIQDGTTVMVKHIASKALLKEVLAASTILNLAEIASKNSHNKAKALEGARPISQETWVNVVSDSRRGFMNAINRSRAAEAVSKLADVSEGYFQVLSFLEYVYKDHAVYKDGCSITDKALAWYVDEFTGPLIGRDAAAKRSLGWSDDVVTAVRSRGYVATTLAVCIIAIAHAARGGAGDVQSAKACIDGVLASQLTRPAMCDNIKKLAVAAVDGAAPAVKAAACDVVSKLEGSRRQSKALIDACVMAISAPVTEHHRLGDCYCYVNSAIDAAVGMVGDAVEFVESDMAASLSSVPMKGEGQRKHGSSRTGVMQFAGAASSAMQDGSDADPMGAVIGLGVASAKTISDAMECQHTGLLFDAFIDASEEESRKPNTTTRGINAISKLAGEFRSTQFSSESVWVSVGILAAALLSSLHVTSHAG